MKTATNAVKKPVGLSTVEEARLRRSLRRSAPSEPWVDAQIVTLTDPRAGKDPVMYRFHNPRAFPPGGRRGTAMRWCRACGRYTPGPCVALVETRLVRTGPVDHATMLCDDCRIAIDEAHYRALFDALPHLRPAGSQSVVVMHSRPR